MNEVATKQISAFALPVPSSAGALVPVTPGPTPTTARLDAALDQVARLGRAIDTTHERFLAARTNGAQRWVVHNRGKFVLGGGAAGAAACLTTVAGISAAVGSYPSAPAWGLLCAIAAAVGFGGMALAANIADRVEKRGAGSENPLSSSDVGPVVDQLREMPQRDQALVHSYLTTWAARRVSSGHLTPAAYEALTTALDVDTEAHAPEVRAVRAATLFKTVTREKPKDADAWLAELLAVLSECPSDERRDLAAALIARLFPNEKCVAKLTADDANKLYGVLREAQKEEKPGQPRK